MSWIKIDHTTPDKPEIVQMAAILGIEQDLVFTKCVRVWIWADQQSVSGNAIHVTETFLDRYTLCEGFAKAMRKAGWLTGEDGALTFPHFDHHNGKTAKMRANTQIRVQSYRHDVTLLKQECNKITVTSALPEKIREDKIREEVPHTPLPLAPQIPNGRVSVLRIRLCRAFNRTEDQPWGNDEEHMLVDTARRPDCLTELDEMLAIQERRGRYFPQSLSSLLQNWTKTLDIARNPGAQREPKKPFRNGPNI